jgi:hypothetical protein
MRLKQGLFLPLILLAALAQVSSMPLLQTVDQTGRSMWSFWLGKCRLLGLHALQIRCAEVQDEQHPGLLRQ